MASARLSVCRSVPSACSPWLTRGSMRRGQRTFRPDSKEDRHTCLTGVWTPSLSTGCYKKRNVTVRRPSVCLSVPSACSPWLTRGSMRRGQRTFRPDDKEHRNTCLTGVCTPSFSKGCYKKRQRTVHVCERAADILSSVLTRTRQQERCFTLSVASMNMSCACPSVSIAARSSTVQK